MGNRKLYFYYGTMGSAKTLRLLTMAYNLEEKNIPFMVLKPSQDTRDGSGVIQSRVGLSRKCVMIDDNVDIYNAVLEYNKILLTQFSKLEWILIDECQFLSEQQIDQLGKIVDKLQIDVACFGLRTDFQTKLFTGSKRLMEIADTIEEIKSRCSCGRQTSINARFDSEGEIVLDGDQVMVGGNELYTPICRKCYYEKIKNKILKKDNEL